MQTGLKKKPQMAKELTTNRTMMVLNENEPSDLRDTSNAEKLTVCTFLSAWLINEGNYLGSRVRSHCRRC